MTFCNCTLLKKSCKSGLIIDDTVDIVTTDGQYPSGLKLNVHSPKPQYDD
jgi:hypothetical protein